MKKIKFVKENFEQISSMILSDINRLRTETRVSFENIKVAMSISVADQLNNYWHAKNSKLIHDNFIFGFEIKEGLNDQICVFDDTATIDDFSLEPIELTFDHD